MIRRKHTTKIRGRHVVVRQSWAEILTPRVVVIGTAAFAAALIAMGHSAAQVGLPTYALGVPGNILNSPGSAIRPFARELAERGRVRRGNRARAAAIVAIRQAPLHAPALAISGFSLGQKRPEQGRAMMRQAVSISRREGLAQLWLINRAVKLGDAPGALNHYDAVLRTMSAGEDMYLQLTAIAQVPQGRRALRPYIRPATPWLNQFLNTAASRSPQAAPVAELLIDSPRLPANYAMGNAGDVLIQRLAAERDFRRMWALYDVLPNVDRSSARGFALPPSEKGDGRFVPITWAMGSDGDYGATLEKAVLGSGSSIVAFASSGTRGVAARKLAKLAAGTYRLSWTVSGQTGNPGAFASISIGCAVSAARTASRNMFTTQSGVNDDPTRLAMNFTVPSGCLATVAELTIAGGEGSAPSEIVVEDFRVSPTNHVP